MTFLETSLTLYNFTSYSVFLLLANVYIVTNVSTKHSNLSKKDWQASAQHANTTDDRFSYSIYIFLLCERRASPVLSKSTPHGRGNFSICTLVNLVQGEFCSRMSNQVVKINPILMDQLWSLILILNSC